MQHIDDIRQKYFMECKKIISDLLYTENAEDLADNKYMIDKLLEKVSFLKLINENPELFSYKPSAADESFVEEHPHILELSAEEEAIFENEEKPTFTDEESKFEFANEVPQNDVTEPEIDEIPIEEEVSTEEDSMVKEEIQEEVINEAPETVAEISEEKPEDSVEINDSSEENLEEEFAVEELIEEATISEEAYQKSVEQTEAESEERRKIQEIEKSEPVTEKENLFEETVEHPHHKEEKKFKLPHIKGLKTVESLFNDDPLEHEKKEPAVSILKSNVPTDFMEAEKPKQEFKLDLNDRIAFSKMLFGGSQSEMNEAVNTLNGFKTLDEAKEFLSDIYYQRNWKKVDEYAQRLWHLVENKFQ